MNNQWFSKFAVWIVIALVLFTVVKQFGGTTTSGNQIGYSEFLDEVQARRIKQVTLTEGGASGAEILAETESNCRADPSFMTVEQWRRTFERAGSGV